MNMLIKQKNQLAAASHLVDGRPKHDFADRNVMQSATSEVVKNILKRNSKLPRDMVQNQAFLELK